MEMTKDVVPSVEPAKVEKQIKEFRPNPAFSTNLVPKGFKEAMEMATVLAKSNVVPTGMSGRPEACFVAIGFGMELGLPPLQAIQNIMVVNGRPTIWGDAAHALVLGSGMVEEFDEDAPDVALKQGFGRCRIKIKGIGEVERRFTIEDAKRAKLWTKEGPWQTYPGRMLQMRARSWAERDGAPNILKGIQFREEMEDIEVIHPAVQMPKRTEQPRIVQDAKLEGEGSQDIKTTQNPAQNESQEAEEVPGDAQAPGDSVLDADLKITGDRRMELFKMWTAAKISIENVKAYVKEKFNLDGSSELTNGQADELEKWIRSQIK